MGLLILRLVAGSSVVAGGLAELESAQAVQPVILALAAILVSAFLALAGVYFESRHSKNAETEKSFLFKNIACGLFPRMCITPLRVGKTT